jgi:hypothetical protein
MWSSYNQVNLKKERTMTTNYEKALNKNKDSDFRLVYATLAVADELRQLRELLASMATDGKNGGKALEVRA